MRIKMKTRYLLLALILAATPAFAARQTISPVAPSSSPADLRGKLNVELDKANDNDIEFETDIATKAGYADVLQRWHSYPSGYTFAIDDLTMYGGKIYKAVTSHVKGGSNPLVDTANWHEFFVAGQGSNLAATAGASTVVVTNDNGTGFTLPAATGSTAGAMTAADATKLSGVAAGATANASDAYLLALGNHTGTLASTSISDFSTAVNTTMASIISKVAGIQSGAQVNVKPDWNATPGAANEILNQPDVVATDQDFTVTAEATFEDIILPLFDTAAFDAQNPEPTCSAGSYFLYFTATKLRQCVNGTASDAGSGGSMTYPGAGIANSTGSAWGTSYTVDSDLGDSTNLSTAFPTASAVKTLVNGLSASATPSYSATPADVADGVVWYNTTAKELCVAESAGVSCVAMTYAADDNDPSNATPWFTDETDIALSTAKTSNAITLAGLGTRGASISVTGSSGAGYSKNSAACTATSGKVYTNDTVAACVTSSGSNSTATTSTVTIGTDSDTYSVTTASGVTYIRNENFDGTGTPTGFSGTPSGYYDFDYTGTGVIDTESLMVERLSGGSQGIVTVTGTTSATDGVWVEVDVNIITGDGAYTTILNGWGSAVSLINLRKVGTTVYTTAPATLSSSSGIWSSGEHNFRLYYKASTGASDGIVRVYHFNGSTYDKIIEKTDHNQTIALTSFQLASSAADTVDVVYDNFKWWVE
jgi:hypothetical protein